LLLSERWRRQKSGLTTPPKERGLAAALFKIFARTPYADSGPFP
jgi:hypothetical protein